jgi:cysteinyl-tRNA synthetase
MLKWNLSSLMTKLKSTKHKVKLFNTLKRKKETFVPLNDETALFYSCGPTVYWYQHIGNLRTYIFNDVLKRALIYNNYKVKHVMNYTDVGHLTSDADTGEDKMEKAALREGKTAKDIAQHYIESFEKDAAKLNILAPSVTCKATDYIKEQIELVQVLEKKGLTYKTADGIYMNTAKVRDYGKLDPHNIKGLKAGKRVDIGDKKNNTDFALWKFSEKPGLRQQEWDSPWGIGYPGWHTECCVMSTEHLGKQFDIHTGGEDHIQIHHTNEIAQSEAAYGKKPWVRYWLHGSFLTFKGEKVSKSKGGLFTVTELEEQGFLALDYRYLCLNTHYRKQLNFSLEVLEGAKNTYERLRNTILELKSKDDSLMTEKFELYRNEFGNSVNDDLNMPQALAVLWSVLKEKQLGSKEKLVLAYDFDEVLGLGLKEVKELVVKAPAEVEKLLVQREDARKAKDWKKADELRDKIKASGYSINDTPEGPKLKKI